MLLILGTRGVSVSWFQMQHCSAARKELDGSGINFDVRLPLLRHTSASGVFTLLLRRRVMEERRVLKSDKLLSFIEKLQALTHWLDQHLNGCVSVNRHAQQGVEFSARAIDDGELNN